MPNKKLLDSEKSGRSIARLKQTGRIGDDNSGYEDVIQEVEVATSAEAVYIYGIDGKERKNLRLYIKELEDRLLDINNGSGGVDDDELNKIKEEIKKELITIKNKINDVIESQNNISIDLNEEKERVNSLIKNINDDISVLKKDIEDLSNKNESIEKKVKDILDGKIDIEVTPSESTKITITDENGEVKIKNLELRKISSRI